MTWLWACAAMIFCAVWVAHETDWLRFIAYSALLKAASILLKLSDAIQKTAMWLMDLSQKIPPNQ